MRRAPFCLLEETLSGSPTLDSFYKKKLIIVIMSPAINADIGRVMTHVVTILIATPQFTPRIRLAEPTPKIERMIHVLSIQVSQASSLLVRRRMMINQQLSSLHFPLKENIE